MFVMFRLFWRLRNIGKVARIDVPTKPCLTFLHFERVSCWCWGGLSARMTNALGKPRLMSLG